MIFCEKSSGLMIKMICCDIHEGFSFDRNVGKPLINDIPLPSVLLLVGCCVPAGIIFVGVSTVAGCEWITPKMARQTGSMTLYK